MPKPRKNEDRNDYVSRCIPEVKKEGASQKAAVGKCEGMYTHYTNKDKKKGK